MQLNFHRIALNAAGLALVALLVVIGSVRQATAEQPAPPHLREAIELGRGVSSATSNYQHGVGPVAWPGDPGVDSATCRTDCSGFLNALLKHTYGLTDAQLAEKFDAHRPLAKHYFAAIEANRGFKAIDRLSQARPGDIIAVRYLRSEQGENTGHVMLIAGEPRLRKSTAPLIAETLQWEVPVIDESHSGHGVDDSRHIAGGGFHDGLGTGALRVYTDRAGHFAGYSWSVGRKSQFQSQSEHPLVIGRLNLN